MIEKHCNFLEKWLQLQAFCVLTFIKNACKILEELLYLWVWTSHVQFSCRYIYRYMMVSGTRVFFIIYLTATYTLQTHSDHLLINSKGVSTGLLIIVYTIFSPNQKTCRFEDIISAEHQKFIRNLPSELWPQLLERSEPTFTSHHASVNILFQ